MRNKFLKDRLNQMRLQRIIFQAQRSGVNNQILVKTKTYVKSFFFDFDGYEFFQ